jgi:tetratricopeptide (TPR) repeat protein
VARIRHLDLDLLFSQAGAGYRVVVMRSPAGDGQSVSFELPVSDIELENFILRTASFRSRTRRVESARVTAAKQLGGRLFDAVFVGTVGECLHRSMDRARNEGVPLRIRLRVSGCPGLASLPWELLYDRADDWFLALSDRTPVIRYVQQPEPPRPVAVALPLRILLIKSAPEDYSALGLADEWEQVSQALAELDAAGMVQVTELAAATLGELRRALLRDAFHVLHFMGHGGFDADRGGALIFTDRAGHGVPVSSDDLGVLLHDHTSLRLAVLNACEAGRTDPADPFAGVADTLVRRGIPAVIAMQFEVGDNAAIEFAPALYGALAAGRPIDAAVAEARKAIYTVSPLEWATPVLYLRADDGLLFDITSSTAMAARASVTPQVSGDYSEAEAAFREAVRLDPGNADAHTDLGDALHRQGKYSEAEAASREAIRLDPALAWAHNNLGSALYGQQKYAEAEAAFREAVRLDPGNAVMRRHLGKTLNELKR